MAPELGLWWPMSPWLSPGAAWFIFFNALVGAIALMSSRGPGRDDDDRRRPVRTASTVVLESLRSVSIFSFHPTTADHSVAAYSASASQPQLHHLQQDQHWSTFQEQEAQQVNNLVELEPASVHQEETPVAATTAALPAQSAHVAPPAALDASATACEGEAEDGESISLDEAYALARATRHPAVDTVATAAAVPRKIMGRGGACGRGRAAEEVEAKALVDARAEQFIRQFREGLKLERINSILNYTHALRRTAGAH